MDLSTGLVDISIPIYDIQFADKNIPLKLMFHPSGLKADTAEFGMFGLKWVLNGGGFISREVRGYPDENRPHKQGINDIYYSPDWTTLYGGAAYRGAENNNILYTQYGYPLIGLPANYNKYDDTEYDIFTFSLPNGQSGKFILKDINGNKTASFMPYKPYKLNNPTVTYFTADKNKYTKFEIIDDEGYIYSFGVNDMNQAYYANDINDEYSIVWMLTSITSPNKKDIIKFDYKPTSIGNKTSIPLVEINDGLHDFQEEYINFSSDYTSQRHCGIYDDSALYDALKSKLIDDAFYTNYNQPPQQLTKTFYLSKITYNDFNIDFNYPVLSLLRDIKITKDSKFIKKIGFDIENFIYLKNVNIMGSNDEVLEKYSFDYYHLDKLLTLDDIGNKADYWGYYQSEVKNVILKDSISLFYRLPCGNQQIIRKEIGSGNNRYSNSEDMKIGMVKSITYPTGGTTTFDYEGNQYKDNSYTIRQCGGLRIKSIISQEKNGSNLKKREFAYGLNEDGIGQIPSYLVPGVSNLFEERLTTCHARKQGTFVNEDHQDEPLQMHFENYGSYRTRTYTGFFSGKLYTFLNKVVSYDKVTEYNGDKTNNIGKTENYYYNTFPVTKEYEFDMSNYGYQRQSPVTIDPSNFWEDNHIVEKIEYKNKNGLYSKVKQTTYSYESKIIEELYDLSIFKFRDYFTIDFGNSSQSPFMVNDELYQASTNPKSFYGYKTQKYTIGVENLKEIVEETFLNGSSIVQTTTNLYNNNKPTFLKENITINSKGENMSQKFLYPFDISTGVYSQMTIANVISPLVEKVTLKNNNLLSSSLLTYKKSDDNFVPDKNYITQLSNPVPFSGFTAFDGTSKDSRYGSDPENSYDAFDDHGNPIQMTPKGKATTVYIWGYDKDYPIAKIENATYTAGQPNTITPAQQTLIDNAVTAATGENSVVAETNLRGKLQLLRAGFPDALVSTYTYDPLIGITSMTDPKGYTAYYEYDSYGRLKQVKDKEGNILSANKYHYKNQ